VGYAERATALVAMARGERDQGEARLRCAIQTFASVDARCARLVERAERCAGTVGVSLETP
jgi:hypothetical protein